MDEKLVNIYNECVILVIFIALIIANVWNLGDPSMTALGWFIISLILLSLFITWILLIPRILKEIWEKIKKIYEWFLEGEGKKNSNTQESAINSKPDSPAPKKEFHEDKKKVDKVEDISEKKDKATKTENLQGPTTEFTFR